MDAQRSPHSPPAGAPRLTVARFVEYLLASGLLPAAEVQSLLSSLPSAREPDARSFAMELVRLEKLTPYQAAMLYQSKVRGLVIGNYAVLDKIGRGGMGVVFKAKQRRMDRVVALKILPPAVSANAGSVQRFMREVEAAAKLNHPNIVRSFDADRDGNVYFLVMEYVEGSDLSSLVKERGPLTVGQAVSCIVQAGRGLAHAHAVGIIHRDIKPSNLLVDSKGTVKVLDMGLARIESEALGNVEGAGSDQLTKSGSIMGTVDFMSPEQAVNSRKADLRADIYSLGCTLFTLLTGRPMYAGETLMEKLLEHREAPIPPLRQLRPDVPEPLETVFRRMVAKKPGERQQAMTAVVAELEKALSAGGQRMASVVQIAQAVSDHQRPTLDFDETLNEAPAATGTEPPRLRFPIRIAKKWWALVGMAAATVVIFGIVLLRGSKPVREKPVVSKATGTKPVVEPAAQMEALWNGKDLTGWKVLNGTRDDWGMENGVLFTKLQKYLGPAGCWLLTEQCYTDFELTLEFRLAAKADSGIALRAPASGDSGRWAMIQLIDEAGIGGVPPEMITGSIWSVAAPARPAAKPAGQWNQLAARVTDSRVIVDLNGTRIQDIKLENTHPKAGAIPGILRRYGRIGLQASNGRVDFRKIMVKRLEASSPLPRGPALESWQKAVAALPPGRQVEEVVRKLQELNPGYDGDESHLAEGNTITEFGCATDRVGNAWPLRAWPKLRSVTLAGTAPGKGLLNDISPLQGLPLTHLRLYHNGNLQNVFPIKGMALQLLDLGHTGVADLSPVKGMSLSEFSCSNTPVVDLLPLKGMPIRSLDFSGSRVTDLSPLQGMPLEYLVCPPVLDERYLELLRSAKTLQKINGKSVALFLYAKALAQSKPITAWRVLLPFPNSTKEPFDPTANGGNLPESEFTKSYTGLESKKIRWSERKTDAEGNLKVETPPANATLFAFVRIESAADSEAAFFVGSDDTMTIWLNGQKVYERANGPGQLEIRDRVVVRLKKGANAILVRCNNEQGDWGFVVRVAPAGGK